uniref:Transmembrane protein 63A n=1 Tax=Amphiprion percula TaxID=161767 RepID=A0A3P8SAA9_AMPPE
MSSPWWWWDQLVNNGTNPPRFWDNSTCYNPSQNTVLSGLEFGGVPIVLLLDFIVFLVLVIIFSIIRKKFWDYGRLALVADNEGVIKCLRLYSGILLLAAIHPQNGVSVCLFLLFLHWCHTRICCHLIPEKIKSRCGMDAIHYLSFQRHLIFLLGVITVTSLAIILPVNMTGDLLSGFKFTPYIQKYTITLNDLLWLHTVFAVLYLFLTVLLLQRHTSQMKDMRRETTRNTLFVCSVPKTATEEDVKTHFSEAYPTCQVCAVTLAYDVAKLMHLDKERLRAGKNLRYYERILEKTEKLELINPRLCGHLCCCTNVDAIEYYSTKEKELLVEVRKQAEVVPQHPLGIAFITLQNEAMAKYILKDFNALECGGASCCCGREPQPSTNSKALRVNKWRVSFAPHPRNVYWENLSVSGFSWYIRYLMLNFFVVLVLTFLTTPTIIINTMDRFNVTKPITFLNSPIISQFFPTLLLWSFSALLPTIVYYSTLGEAHWSRSSEQLSMMRKLYFFLLFMVLILPSLGLTSLAVFFRWLFDRKFLTDGKLRFECVFLPDQGAFFVNYVIAAALVGSGMELLRLPGLLLYAIRMTLARSAAEIKYVKQNQAYEFEYGAMYGWTLCVFTVIMAYSIICPIIVPFGLLYMLLKHLVDRHNLYFAYLPTRLNHQVHLGAVNQALAAPIICLIWLYFFSVLRAGFWRSTSLFTLVVLCITVFFCLGYTCFGHFKYLSPQNYAVSLSSSCFTVYLPRVLNPKSPVDSPQRSKPQQSYGSTDEIPAPEPSPVEEDASEA